jgi:DNA processing protein
MENELLYQIGITLIDGIGDVNAKKLIAHCGSAKAVFEEKKGLLMKVPGIGKKTAASVISQDVLKRAEEEIRFIERYKINALYYLNDNYPKRLKLCNDSPVMLYFKGNATLNESKILGVVGTRKATAYGKSFTEKLISDLSNSGILIVSGLAFGIDICAHRSALANGLNTLGVMGHGLDRIYPTTHKSAAEKMVKQGGLLTEFLSGTNPDRENFPKRNRIVAGMCDAILVVEAAETGGALITAEIAHSYNRDVFAVPGRAGDEFSGGCNKYIRLNKAAMITSAKDLLEAMSWDVMTESKTKTNQAALFNELNQEEQTLVGLIREHDTIGIDDLSLLSKISLSKTSGMLLTLEFSGIVKQLPGKRYRLN